ncbi:MAG: hypothetical protein AAF327_15855 [Cyanobacteria bacterium P01_A01_bin.37]
MLTLPVIDLLLFDDDELPDAPSGYAYLIDNQSRFVLDNQGRYILGKV